MMMILLLAKGRLCSTVPSPRVHPHLSRFFSSATPNPDPKTPTFVFADYLISSFGFSPDKAVKVSNRLARLNSPEKPDSVCRFLNDQGFSQSDVKKLVTSHPDILGSSPQKTLDPNLRSIRDMGLSASAVNQIILSGPQALQLQSTVPRIRFWMDFFGGDEAALVTAFKQNSGLVGHDIGRLVSPKISLLRSQGFSTQEIQRFIVLLQRGITCKITLLEDALKRTKELGFQPGSGMFLHGLRAMVFNTRDALHKKKILLMSFGWSEEDFLCALRKAPGFVDIAEKNLQAKMEFFIGEVNCELSCIVSHPLLLKFSLEKRLRPRNNVLHRLESKGLPVKELSFYAAMNCTDKLFVDKYILPHKEEISGLHEAYIAACA